MHFYRYFSIISSFILFFIFWQLKKTLLKHSWFTKLCYFQVYIYIYIYSLYFFILYIYFLDLLSFFLFILYFNFTILYWFCHISTWILHGYTRVPHPETSSLLPPRTIPLGRPSAPAPSIQYRASNLDCWLVSYMKKYQEDNVRIMWPRF